jgi:hypothetical protein
MNRLLLAIAVIIATTGIASADSLAETAAKIVGSDRQMDKVKRVRFEGWVCREGRQQCRFFEYGIPASIDEASEDGQQVCIRDFGRGWDPRGGICTWVPSYAVQGFEASYPEWAAKWPVPGERGFRPGWGANDEWCSTRLQTSCDVEDLVNPYRKK